MNNIIKTFGVMMMLGLFLVSCESEISSSENNTSAEINATKASNNNSASVSNTCQDAGDTGMTAVYVNESVRNSTIDFDSHNCDMAIYFDENAPKNAYVRNTTIIQETGNSGESTGVWNNGADITVTRSVFMTKFSGQFLPVRFDEGAQGTISSNELTGTHRVGILVRGSDTEADIKDNSIIGSGAKTSGWAENGIQVDQGAMAKIVNNEIIGHWWDGESNFGSTALLIWSDNSKIMNNTFHNNEFSIYLLGNANSVKGNNTSSEIDSQSSLEFKAYGALIAGSENHLAGNSYSSVEGTGDVGIYILPGSSSNKITGNRISGFADSVLDVGDDSMIRGTPAPPQGM